MASSMVKWKQKERQRPHHKSKVWQLGKTLCLEIYRVTAYFPSDERFELKS